MPCARIWHAKSRRQEGEKSPDYGVGVRVIAKTAVIVNQTETDENSRLKQSHPYHGICAELLRRFMTSIERETINASKGKSKGKQRKAKTNFRKRWLPKKLMSVLTYYRLWRKTIACEKPCKVNITLCVPF